MLALITSTPRTFGRIVAAATVHAAGEGSMLDELGAQYVDPWDETREF
jgi:hypothetical protein